VCGHYENDSCRAQSGRRCNVKGCPFLSAETPGRRRAASGRGLDAVDRRTVVVGGATALAAAVAGGVVAGTAAGLGRAVGGAPSPASESVTLRPPRPDVSSVPGSDPTTTAPESAAPTTRTPPGTSIGLASDVPVGGSASFTDPTSGDPGLVLQLTKGRFAAYDAICPHAGCTVGYSSAAKLIVCPCHGSEFDPNTGAVVNPPAQHGLSSIQVAVDASGELVIDG
jgi:thiosulfate dehydrogenase [quinone] large subunit